MTVRGIASGSLDQIPDHYVEIESVMSNFDHEIDEGAEERLRSGPYWSGYPAMNFYGGVWFGEGRFRCAIKCYYKHVETIVGDSLQEIMDEASRKYGHE